MGEDERQRALQRKATVGSSEGNQGAAAALRARLKGNASAAAAAPSEGTVTQCNNSKPCIVNPV